MREFGATVGGGAKALRAFEKLYFSKLRMGEVAGAVEGAEGIGAEWERGVFAKRSRGGELGSFFG